MFHKAVDLSLNDGTIVEVTFQNGDVKQYDMEQLFDKYPALSALRDRELFLRGKLMGAYGIIWNDELDIDAETIFEDGVTVRKAYPASVALSNAFAAARLASGLSQSELSRNSGIDQSDISKIERGAANPSVQTLNRLAAAMDMELEISFKASKK